MFAPPSGVWLPRSAGDGAERRQHAARLRCAEVTELLLADKASVEVSCCCLKEKSGKNVRQ